jgi:hypothetical protein
MAVRLFLGLHALLWLPYGLFCAFVPSFLEGAASLAAAPSTGTTEIRAMYGGLQAAIGVFALLALVRPVLRRPALLMLAFLCSGLASARLLGVGIDGAPSAYTLSVLGFETVSAGLAWWLVSTSGVSGQNRRPHD